MTDIAKRRVPTALTLTEVRQAFQSRDVALDAHTHTSADVTDFTEAAQDAVGAMVADTATIDLTYTDATPELKADVKTDSIGNTLLANMADSTVKGQIVGGSGDPVDLTPTQLLTIIKTVDGAASGLDADLLDGMSSAAFAATAHTHTSADVTDFTEASQDAVGAMIADTATINLTYTDGTPELKGDVIPAGIKLDDLGAPDDNTDLNASTTAHGLLKKLSNVATEYMDGTGAWSTPAGGSADINAQCMAWMA